MNVGDDFNCPFTIDIYDLIVAYSNWNLIPVVLEPNQIWRHIIARTQVDKPLSATWITSPCNYRILMPFVSLLLFSHRVRVSQLASPEQWAVPSDMANFATVVAIYISFLPPAQVPLPYAVAFIAEAYSFWLFLTTFSSANNLGRCRKFFLPLTLPSN